MGKNNFPASKLFFFVLAVYCISCCGSSTTAPRETFRFVVLGDSRGNDSSEPVNTAILGNLSSQIAALDPKPDLVLFLGDLVFSGGLSQLNQWNSIIAPIPNAGIPVYPTLGNHELLTGLASGQEAYRDYFELPTNGPSGYDELAYSVEHKNALFVCLDSYYFDGQTFFSNQITNAQLAWLNNLLGSTTKKFKFVFTHSPAYPVDGHIGNSLDSNQAQRDAFWNILDDGQATIFFAGHEHLYSRWGINSAVNSNWNNKLLQIIAGGAGAPIYISSSGVKADVIISQNHFVMVDINGNELVLTVYNDEGIVIDIFSLSLKY
jgi:Icc protein